MIQSIGGKRVNASSSKLTIFEGVDGSGKTTLAKAYAKATDARYVHFGPMLGVDSLTRIYVEAMLPALLGYQDVVFDRSWYSETPYADAKRMGKRRLKDSQIRALERLAARCGAVTVLCDPGLETCTENFLARKGEEYLDDCAGIQQVHEAYQISLPLMQKRGVPVLSFDYTQTGPYGDDMLGAMANAIDSFRYRRHQLDILSAGYLDDSSVLIVGQDFADHGKNDSLYQWPFGGLEGCSKWLNELLEEASIPESRLVWVNADQDLVAMLRLLPVNIPVIALGVEAAKAAREARMDPHVGGNDDIINCPHPQYWRRFHSSKPYELIKHLDVLTGGQS